MPQAMFGAPIGTMAAQDQERQNMLAPLEALQAIGNLEQVPSQMRLRNAQAGHYEAITKGLGADQADLLLMSEYEKAAREASTAIPATEGRDADYTDVAKFRPGSMTDPLRKLYDVMVQKGAPARLLTPLADKISKIAQGEAVEGYRRGQAYNQALTAEQTEAEQLGSFAQMGIDSPEGYAQMRMLAAQQGAQFPPHLRGILDALPQDWNQGKEMLRPFVVQSLKLKDAIAMQQKDAKLKSDLLTAAGTRARNSASAALANARHGLVKEQTTVLRKLGGEGSPTSQAASEALTESRRLKIEADRLKLYPRVPVDHGKIRPGVSYTLKDGNVGRAITTADGKIAFEEILPPLPQHKSGRSADAIRKEQLRRAALGGVPLDGLDDDDDEGED